MTKKPWTKTKMAPEFIRGRVRPEVKWVVRIGSKQSLKNVPALGAWSERHRAAAVLVAPARPPLPRAVMDDFFRLFLIERGQSAVRAVFGAQ